MRKLAIATALLSTALATPAVARDGSWYAGVEGGFMILEDADISLTDVRGTTNDAATINFKRGLDADIVGGYDMGPVRLEAEVGFKRANVDEMRLGTVLGGTGRVDADGRARALSVMANALLDFGDDNGWAGYVGGGVGLASVRMRANTTAPGAGFAFSDSDRALAWQLIAGVRTAITPNIDVGLKYRFFNVSDLRYSDVRPAFPGDPLSTFGVETDFRSHSLLASVLFNFGAPLPLSLIHI